MTKTSCPTRSEISSMNHPGSRLQRKCNGFPENLYSAYELWQSDRIIVSANEEEKKNQSSFGLGLFSSEYGEYIYWPNQTIKIIMSW